MVEMISYLSKLRTAQQIMTNPRRTAEEILGDPRTCVHIPAPTVFEATGVWTKPPEFVEVPVVAKGKRGGLAGRAKDCMPRQKRIPNTKGQRP